MGSTPPEAYVAALAGFERMTIHRLSGLLARRPAEQAFASPPASAAARAVRHVVRPRADLAAAWRRSGERRRAGGGVGAVPRAGIRSSSPAMRTIRTAARRSAPPAVLFVRGDLAVLDGRRVGIVGTRNATQRGRDTAAQLGDGLAADGVHVVSGLARGIDGAAHRGALAVDGARPVAVVANGPDAPIPA